MPETGLLVAKWVEALEGLPLLECLVLDKMLEDKPLLEPVTRRVEMAHLAHIELYDWYIATKCTRLLDSLVLPLCREITLEVQSTYC